MSTDLSDSKFTDSAQEGAFSWLFEGFRTRMRDTARAVRMESAWQNWPALHKVSKALHEALETPADREAKRQSSVQDFVKRLGLLYPDPSKIGDINDPKTLERIAIIDLGLSDSLNNPNAEFPLDEILALYQEANGKIPDAQISLDAHAEDMDGWAALNQAVGGDLWTNPAKAEIMRELDAQMPNASWEEFHARVVQTINDRSTTPSIDIS